MTVVILGTHCRRRAPKARPSPRQSGMLPAFGKTESRNEQKGNSIKASMSLKTNDGLPKTNSKRTENQGELAAQCALYKRNSAFLTPRASCRWARRRNTVGFESAGAREIRRIVRKYKNSGNELNKLFRIKDIHFLMVQIRRVLGADLQ